MPKINFPIPTREPTKRELDLYMRWVEYLKLSRLTETQIYARAAELATQGKKP